MSVAPLTPYARLAPPWPGLPSDLFSFDADARWIRSPALVFRRTTIEQNLEMALRVARGAARLRPHLKSHKCAALVEMQVSRGITKFKVATLAEAEMAAEAGARDVLVAYPLVDNQARDLPEVRRRYWQVDFSAIVDSVEGFDALRRFNAGLGVWLDVDAGMGRTGASDRLAGELLARLRDSKAFRLRGLHVYDGHVVDRDPEVRRAAVRGIWARIQELRRASGHPALPVVAGGTPTFPFWGEIDDAALECSPGIFLLHDARYATKYGDLPFEVAALVRATVVSRPALDRFTLDCGTKALAPDLPMEERAALVGVPTAVPLAMSEEHWVWRVDPRHAPEVGGRVYLVPGHVCPTVALHREAWSFDVTGGRSKTHPILGTRHAVNCSARID